MLFDAPKEATDHAIIHFSLQHRGTDDVSLARFKAPRCISACLRERLILGGRDEAGPPIVDLTFEPLSCVSPKFSALTNPIHRNSARRIAWLSS
jgi:hypothetical protein